MTSRSVSVALLVLLGCGGSDDDGSSSDAAVAPADAARPVDDAALGGPDANVAAPGPSISVTTAVPESVPRASGAQTYILPQISETEGSVADGAAGAVDTVITAVYDAGQAGLPAGSGAGVDLYLFDRATGDVLAASGGNSVCDPCVVNLGVTSRLFNFSIAELVVAAGGFAGPVDAFGLMVVGGSDPDGVSLEATTRRVTAHPLSLSLAPLENHHGVDNVLVVPHTGETAGDPLSVAGARDLVVNALYTGGLGNVPDGVGADIDLYLFDETGGTLRGQNTVPVCNPCVFSVGTVGNRLRTLRIEDRLTATGGFVQPEVAFYGIAVVGGNDPSAAVVWATRAESGD